MRWTWNWGSLTSAVTAFTAVAALLFTGLSLQQTRAQNQLDESGQITDRFNAAVTNLGSGTETIRIGGILALQRIMQDSRRDQPAVVEVLSAFVREHAPLPAADVVNYPTRFQPSRPAAISADTVPSIDVQTALTVLAGRDSSQDQGAIVDLDNTDLNGASLEGAQLEDANLQGAFLADADLADSHFADANLQDSNLYDADLLHADLSRAFLQNATFSGSVQLAKLNGAVLDDALMDSRSLCDGAVVTRPEWGYQC